MVSVVLICWILDIMLTVCNVQKQFSAHREEKSMTRVLSLNLLFKRWLLTKKSKVPCTVIQKGYQEKKGEK